MDGAYASYFENPFLALRMARTDYKAQAEHALRAVRLASLGAAFTPLLSALEQAIKDFDENLTDRQEPTAEETSAYHLARTAWLGFVDDTMKDYVTPKLRKLPVYASFKKFSKSKLAALSQPELLTKSKGLLELYADNQGALYPTLKADAEAKFNALAALDKERDESEATTDTTILDLLGDRAAIAKAQRHLKAQLELTFDEPAKVYSFFDFSATKEARKAKPKAPKVS